MIKNLRLKGHHREREKTEHGTGEDIHDHKSDKSAVSIINEECVQPRHRKQPHLRKEYGVLGLDHYRE